MSQFNPTEGELAILRVLWRKGEPATVHDVHAELVKTKHTAYTTVLKMLTIMNEKGLVLRDESGRKHRYVPLCSESAVQLTMLKGLVKNVFSGSAFKLMQSALGDDQATEEELDEVSRLIAQAKARRAKER